MCLRILHSLPNTTPQQKEKKAYVCLFKKLHVLFFYDL